MHDGLLDGVTSYVSALFLMLLSSVEQITLWGGLLLLVVRLIADVPRAWKQIKKWTSDG